LRIIHIRRILPIPYPTPYLHAIGFGLSISTWILEVLLRILKIRIRIGSVRTIIHTTFTPSRQAEHCSGRTAPDRGALLIRTVPSASDWRDAEEAEEQRGSPCSRLCRGGESGLGSRESGRWASYVAHPGSSVEELDYEGWSRGLGRTKSGPVFPLWNPPDRDKSWSGLWHVGSGLEASLRAWLSS
jgi:hypothetical protein